MNTIQVHSIIGVARIHVKGTWLLLGVRVIIDCKSIESSHKNNKQQSKNNSQVNNEVRTIQDETLTIHDSSNFSCGSSICEASERTSTQRTRRTNYLLIPGSSTIKGTD